MVLLWKELRILWLYYGNCTCYYYVACAKLTVFNHNFAHDQLHEISLDYSGAGLDSRTAACIVCHSYLESAMPCSEITCEDYCMPIYYT